MFISFKVNHPDCEHPTSILLCFTQGYGQSLRGVDCGLYYDDTQQPFPQAVDAGCACVATVNKKGEIKNQKTKLLNSPDSHQGKVMNCNNCGKCSNCRDMEIYFKSSQDTSGVVTSQLFDFECSLAYYITKTTTGDTGAGRAVARSCLAANTAKIVEGGLSDSCLDCWVDAVQCTPEECLGENECGPILVYLLEVNEQGNTFDGIFPSDLQASFLNCLVCDALTCSPPFVGCAGASRRTIGYESPVLQYVADILGQPVCDRASEDNVCGFH
uniref:Uncharacterized protein n=1 Tax=Amphora coffeiformis TaxID=265554 RepID=A0A7S3L4Q0_9STRA|mmetsp:Transcript_12781/g.24299  ORF Transcript_12781/g.24299 Transcript_12781/m.24299 type:complete len:271 (-) Transcript_12781:54-866(-)|eukprot:scaffold294_cov221-Amphora_coffeaeformis.AAC.1